MKSRLLKRRGGYVLAITLIVMAAVLVLSSLIVFFLTIARRDINAAKSALAEKINIDSCGEEFLSEIGDLSEYAPAASDDDKTQKTYIVYDGGEFIWKEKTDADEIPEDCYIAEVTVYYSSETLEKGVISAACEIKNADGETLLTVKTDREGNITLWKYGEAAK